MSTTLQLSSSGDLLATLTSNLFFGTEIDWPLTYLDLIADDVSCILVHATEATSALFPSSLDAVAYTYLGVKIG